MGQMTSKPMRPDWPAAWTGARERLRRELGDAVFDAWIGPLTLESWDKDELEHRRRQAVRAQLGVEPLCRAHRARAEGRGRRAAIDLDRADRAQAGHRRRPRPRARAQRAAGRELYRAARPKKSQPRMPAADCGRACCIRSRPSTASFAGPANEFGHRRGARLRRRPEQRHSPALHPWRVRLTARRIF